MSDLHDERTMETENLRLVACGLAHFEAMQAGREELGRLLNVSVPDSWPVFPEAMPYGHRHLKVDPASEGWITWLFLHKGDRALVGEGGYKGKPDAEGMVEIGYAVIPEYRCRGLASEAARALTRRAFSHPEVKVVQAHTLKDGVESMRVLEKLGMKPAGTSQDPDEGEVLRWRLARTDYE